MGLFSRNKEKKERAAIDALWAKLDGKELHYVVRRSESGEQVLGKGGRIMAPGGHIRIMAGEKEVFFNPDPSTVTAGELMALNGVLIKGYNTLLEKNDTIVAYYAYYRK